MHPAEIGAHGEDGAKKVQRARPIEKNGGRGGMFREGFDGAANNDLRIGAKRFEKRQGNIVGDRKNQNGIFFHGHAKPG